MIALATSWVLYLSGASEDPRMLLPAWVSITTVSKAPFVGKKKDRPGLLIHSQDLNGVVPFVAAEDKYQKGDFGICERLLYCGFYQFVLAATPAASDKGE